MRRGEECAGNRSKRRMMPPCVRGFEPGPRDIAVTGAGRTQLRRMIDVEGDLERPDPAVLHVEPGVAREPPDPVVVEREAADAKVEQRSALVPLDIRRQHAGRRLRRAATRVAIVDYRAPDTPRRQFPRHRGADDPSANHDH